MGIKVLLAGNNRALIQEIFSSGAADFVCQSSTTHRDDLLSHFESFEPDVVLFCLYKEPQENLYKLPTIAKNMEEKEIDVFVTGDIVDCDSFERAVPDFAKQILRKPITTGEIIQAISAAELEKTQIKEFEKYQFESLEKKRAKKEKARAFDERRRRELEEEDARHSLLNETAKSLMADASGANKEQVTKSVSSAVTAAADMLLGGKKAKKRILAVDDDNQNLKIIKNYLADEYDVATALNTRVAWKFLENKHVDLVLLDYEMPNESGAEFLARIRENEKMKDIPVLFLTGITQQGKIKDVLALRPQGYLLKPISKEKLQSQVKKFI